MKGENRGTCAKAHIEERGEREKEGRQQERKKEEAREIERERDLSVWEEKGS